MIGTFKQSQYKAKSQSVSEYVRLLFGSLLYIKIWKNIHAKFQMKENLFLSLNE